MIKTNFKIKDCSFDSFKVAHAVPFAMIVYLRAYFVLYRYSTSKDPTQDPLLPKSRILTYFSKTLLQPEGGETNDKKDAPEISKRKSAFEQLPIKPKPLTIRKNPSIEPPKLKAQYLSSAPYRQRVQELQTSSRTQDLQSVSLASKTSKSLSGSETDENSLEIPSKKLTDAENKNIETQPSKVSQDQCETKANIISKEIEAPQILVKEAEDSGNV